MNEITNYSLEDNVHIGFWINWSRGQVLGSTITLSKNHGGVLTAFLAILISFTAASTWVIIAFAIHRHFSSMEKEDSIHHQRQVILRNSRSGFSALRNFAGMIWARRNHKSSQLHWRVMPLVIMAFLVLGLFAAASILSSKIANSMGNEVLLSGKHCGWRSLRQNALSTATTTQEMYNFEKTVADMNYVDVCYRGKVTKGDCNIYVKSRLTYNITRNVECPFPGKERICQELSNTVRFDTNYHDIHHDLGLNTRPEERFLWRTVTDCTPIRTEEYSSIKSHDPWSSGRPFVSYLFGRALVAFRNGGRVSISGVEELDLMNATFRWPADPPLSNNSPFNVKKFSLAAVIYYTKTNGTVDAKLSYFRPVPELFVPDADGSLFFLTSNDILFKEPVEDKWFSAHRFHSNFTYPDITYGAFHRDDPMKVLGCVERQQFCNPRSGKPDCTPLGSIIGSQEQTQGLWNNKMQESIWKWFDHVPILTMSLVVDGLADRVLLASQISDVASPFKISDTQWELEAEHMFQAVLAARQREFIQRASGPSNPAMLQYWNNATDPTDKIICKMQKIRSSAYTSFSVFGLGIVLGVCGLLNLTSMVLESLIRRHDRRSGDLYKSLEWTTNEALQLHRLAHEGVGAGTWQRTVKDYPITEPGQMLALLDISNKDHPKLKVLPSDDFSVLKPEESRIEDVMEPGLGTQLNELDIRSRTIRRTW